MAITIEANYSKKLGLPEYSSHQYSVTVRTEVTDLAEIEAESSRLYSLLQSSVDREIREAGWLPGRGNVPESRVAVVATPGEAAWRCSDRQRALIVKIVEENGLEREAVNDLAVQRTGKGVRELNRLEASALIDELLGSRKGAPAKRHPAFAAGRGVRGSR